MEILLQLGSILMLYLIPGFIFTLFVNKRDLYLDIPAYSILYWITFSLVAYLLYGKFGETTIIIGSILLALALAVWLVFNKKLNKRRFRLDKANKSAYLLLLIPIAIVAITVAFTYQRVYTLPNYDPQTHGVIIKNLINGKDWLHLNSNSLTEGVGSFYPFAMHLIAALNGIITLQAPLISLKSTTIILLFLLPLFTYRLAYTFTKNRALSLYSSIASTLYYYFPYGVLQWGGFAQLASQILMIWALSPIIELIQIKSHSKKSISMLLITALILLGIIGLIHPSTAITMLIFLLPVLIIRFKNLLNFKNLLLLISVSVIPLVVMVLAIKSFLPSIYSIFLLFFNGNLSLDLPGQSENYFSLSNFVIAYLATARQWFVYGQFVLILPILFAAYSFVKNKKSPINKRLVEYLLIPMLTLLIILGFARGASNLPIINHITSIYYHSYRRVAYYLNIPLYIATGYGILLLKDFSTSIQTKLKLNTSRKKLFSKVLHPVVGVLTITITLVLMINSIKSDLKVYAISQDNVKVLQELKKQNMTGQILQLPNHYPEIAENNLNWVNSISPETPALLHRSLGDLTHEALIKRIDFANAVEIDPTLLCKQDPSNDTYVRFIYLSREPYYRGNEHVEYYDIDQVNAIEDQVKKLECAKLFVKNGAIAIYEIETE